MSKLKAFIQKIILSRKYLLVGAAFILLFSCLVLPWRIFSPIRSVSSRIDDLANIFSYFSFTEEESFYKDFALVLIDDESIRHFASKWPLSRDVYAQLLDVLNDEGARVVGLDLVFAGKGKENEDALLSQSIRNFKGKLVFAYYLDRGLNVIAPEKELIGDAETGFINTPSDNIGLTRSIEAFRKTVSFFDFAFSIKIAAAYWQDTPLLENGQIRFKKVTIPLNKYNSFYLQFFQPKPIFKQEIIPMITLLKTVNRDYPPGFFRDKIVLVGPAAKIIGDFHFTPIGRFPGMFIHVNSLLNILNKRVVRRVEIFPILALVGLAILLFSFSGTDIMRTAVSAIAYLLILFWINVIGMRYFNVVFDYGDLVLFIAGGLAILGGSNYFAFFYSLNSAKNKAVSDPLFGLFIYNYFCFRLGLEKEKIYFGKDRYLVFIILERLLKETKKVGFEKLKKTWVRVNAVLRKRQSSFWGTVSDDKIVGFMVEMRRGNARQDLSDLQKVVEGLFQIEGVEIKVKMGYRLLKKTDFGLDLDHAIPYFFKKMEEPKGLLLDLGDTEVPAHFEGIVRRGIQSDFEHNIEEKNQRLLDLIEQLRKEQKQREDAYLELLGSLVNALEAKDEYTKGHSHRVSNYAVLLGQKLGLPEEEIDNLRKAGTMHDVGKIGLPDIILHKRGRLTDEEYEIVKKHAQMGATIINPIRFFDMIRPYILHHHERFDGKGYPAGLKGKEIPLGAQIMSIADVFDAITTARDYKPAFSVQEAIAELRRVKGVQFDPELVEVFVQALQEKGYISDGQNK